MGTRSKASVKREQQRLSLKTIEFKRKVNELLENADPEIAYIIKKDLAVMTNMPFYKDRPTVIKITRSETQLICEFVTLFSKCEDKEFIKVLLKKLSANQSQTIRKVAPRIGEKKDIWEHAIPAKFIIDEIIVMIHRNDVTNLPKLLKLYIEAGQRGVTKEQDLLLREYRHQMPIDWNWQDENADPLARHKKVGIN